MSESVACVTMGLMAIGNLKDAQTALDAAAGKDFDHYVLSDYGSNRQTFLINGVVYKIHRWAFNPKRWNANLGEWENYKRLRDISLPAHLAVPEMSLWMIGDEPIIAAEYIDGKAMDECIEDYLGLYCDHTHCLADRVTNDISKLGILDRCNGNIIYSNGKYWLIDIGETY